MTKTLLATLTTALLAAAGLAQAEEAKYAIDPTHTFVNFEAKHFGVSTLRGRFDGKEGGVVLDRAAKTGTVEINIDMASVSTGVGPLNGHLKSADFFNAEQFPRARFVGNQFTFNGDKIASVSGTLTLLGKTQALTLTAAGFGCYDHPRLKREVCGGDFEATLQRSAFGMTYGLPGIPDNIRLLIQVEAVKQ